MTYCLHTDLGYLGRTSVRVGRAMALPTENIEVYLSIDYGSTSFAAAYKLKGQEGEPEVLTYPPDAVVPNSRKALDELIATVSVSSIKADPGYIVGEPGGVSNTAVFTSLKLLLDESLGAKTYNDRFNKQFEGLNLERSSAGLSEVTRDKLLQAPFKRIFKRIREVLKERYSARVEITIHLLVGHPVHWSINSKHKLRELATEAGHEEKISLTVVLINEARAAFARIIDLDLVKVTSH